jgi:hypothetical protein
MTSLFSRPRLCRTYGITDKTLNRLERTALLSLSWTVKNGLLVTAVSEVDAKMLSVAAVAIESFTKDTENRVWPFHRFLTLRFLQVQNDELEDLHLELVQRNIISETSFSLRTLRTLHEIFIKKLPAQLRYLARIKREPETDEEKEYFGYLLSILEINTVYDHPEYEQGFEFMLDEPTKDIVDAALTTRSDFSSIRKFLAEALSLRMANEGLMFYQLLFHDITVLTATEIKLFLKSSKPSQRARLQAALGQTLDVFRVRSGIEDNMKADQTLSFLRDRVVENLILTVDGRTEEAERTFLNNLRSLMLITERLDQLRPAEEESQSTTLPNYMRGLEIKSVSIKDGGIFQLPAAKVDEKRG